MTTNKIIKIISSIPIILILLYFVPLLGIGAIMINYCILDNKKINKLAIVLLMVGVFAIFPQLIYDLDNIININFDINSFTEKIDELGIYNSKMISYGELLIAFGILSLIMAYFMKVTSYRFMHRFRKYLEEHGGINTEISKQNEMENVDYKE